MKIKAKQEKRTQKFREKGQMTERKRQNGRRKKKKMERDSEYKLKETSAIFTLSMSFFPIITVTSYPPKVGMFLLGR